MQKIFRYSCLTLCVLATLPAAAQRTVSGSVLGEDRTPLPGATVTVKERKTLGAVTDAEGRYALSLPDGAAYTLEASYVGYLPQRRKVAAGKGGRTDFTLTEDAVGLETVVVTGTRTPKLLKDVPIVTRVITAEEIRRTDATHIGDLLQTELPGIEFSYSMDQQVSLNLQGFGGNSVLFLVDGERLAGETLDNVDYSRLNMAGVERIEIVKGAASSLYGSNAVGGVVNIISRTASEPWTVNVNTRFGPHEEQRHGGTVSFRTGGLSSVTDVQHTRTGEVDLTDGRPADEVGDFTKVYGNRTWNVKERLTYAAGDRLKLTARAGYFFRQREKSADVKDRYRDFSGGLKGNYAFGKHDDLEVGYSFDQYDKSDFQVQGGRDVRDYSNVQHVVRALYNHGFGGGKHTLTAGGDYMRDYLMSYQFADNGDKHQHTADAFAQLDLNLTERLNVIAGLRYDYYSDADVDNLSSKLGLMYKVGRCSLRASYAGGFRAPTLKEMYMNFDMASIFMIYGSPDLKPEKSHNYSLSAEYLRGRCNLTVTGFYNQVDNRITTAWDRERKGMCYTNTSRVKIAGLEADASVKHPCGLGARLSYAYTHEHVRTGEPYFSTTRPHTATARIEYGRDWKRYAFDVALHGRFLSRTDTKEYVATASDETADVTYPAYTLWKLTLTQKVGKGIRVTATVDNLFNYVPSYYYSNSPGTTGTTVSAGLSVDIDRLFR